MMVDEDKKVITDIIQKLSDSKNRYQVFNDVVICCAYALANAVLFNQDREDSFNNIIKSYGENGKEEFAKILAHLYNGYSKGEVKDILGEIYEEMNLQNKNGGQFFTPLSVCDVMTKITIDESGCKKQINEKGFCSISDPACGSGRLLYSAYSTLLDYDIDSKNILLIGDDVDIMCCCMTYIQLSLMGANAIVNHKNTLTNEIYDTFYTATYVNNKDLQDKIHKELGEDIEI